MNESNPLTRALACLFLPEEPNPRRLIYMEFREAAETVKSSLRSNDYEPYVDGQFLSLHGRKGESRPQHLVLTYCAVMGGQSRLGSWWSRDGLRPECLSPLILLPEVPLEYLWQEGPVQHWLIREAFDFYEKISLGEPVVPFMMIDERNWTRARGILDGLIADLDSSSDTQEAVEVFRMAQILLGRYPDQIDGEKEE
jgi:hypothetical protein